MHLIQPGTRFPFGFPHLQGSPNLGSQFVGAPTAVPTSTGPGDQLTSGAGGAIAAMQFMQAMQAQLMFWMLPAMLGQAMQQLKEQGLASGRSQHQGWPQQVDPRELAMLLAYWLLSGGQLPNQSRAVGGLPSAGGGGARIPGGWPSGPSGPANHTRTNHTRSLGGASVPGSAPTGRGTSGDFLQAALAQNGDRYVFGAETRLNDPNPHTFDCSELVQWAAHQAGVTIPDGSSNQLAHVRRHGTEISVEQALRTPGALLFRPGHVAISLGDGRTIEARGRNYGVGVFNGRGRFTSAGLIPGMRY